MESQTQHRTLAHRLRWRFQPQRVVHRISPAPALTLEPTRAPYANVRGAGRWHTVAMFADFAARWGRPQALCARVRANYAMVP